ncbi:kinesin-domain-containing protein [Microthyrium microscopicum]|uniref:Kinesin-domain-containing protein n=1 Tax=Microthyrium microscopicum TaxID=703497 RepID=A0A6A6UJS8_9PEZI|nr:kinesin-domain-containing protein [Microthyrium microscopicum]
MSRPPSRVRNMPPPPPRRAMSGLRANSVTPSLTGRSQSPAEFGRARSSPQVTAGTKRKEREYEGESTEGETNINVFVRCRGRNDREVRENSGVVVSTNGVKGQSVDISMGPNALSNKTYHFDGVFSQAADQVMVFDEVVTPVLDEVLRGLNCTIFAYGQTGTGKTYTMSGDITDQDPLPEAAGIVPRVLHELFARLDALPNSPKSGTAPENTVRISFIELYNEELRDLLSTEDSIKLNIVSGDNKKGSTTYVQGMEETYITNARKGVQLLRLGSNKRQVAATKCNDLSSRSHTIFTISVQSKHTTDSGEEHVSTGKLNLVDLAGSENIKNSGAEKKRATEAGLINKSLVALGRVINGLVDRTSHIPYRESKLTRLLQDSLGGRTKTCIIATLSPARSNLEETLSTLDYAFRAKNIKNKPQINQIIPKKTLLKEFTLEIEKLKSELLATRHKNGHYISQDAFDAMTASTDAQKTMIKEQKEMIESMEYKLERKIQELFTLTASSQLLKKDAETTKAQLDSTKDVLERTDLMLRHTKKALDEEAYVAAQHARSEQLLADRANSLITSLDEATGDVEGLHAKVRRRSELSGVHRSRWVEAQEQVGYTTSAVDERLEKLRVEQTMLVDQLASRMLGFVQTEVRDLSAAQQTLKDNSEAFTQAREDVIQQTAQAKSELSEVLGEVASLREDVKAKVGAGLEDLGVAAQRISAGIMKEIQAFHADLHTSYATLGREFRSTFDEMSTEIVEQREELDQLRSQMTVANSQLATEQAQTVDSLEGLVEKEKEIREKENAELMSKIQQLVQATTEQQDLRMLEIGSLPQQFRSVSATHAQAGETFEKNSELLVARSRDFSGKLVKSRDTMKSKIQRDFAAANKHTDALTEVTSSVHSETTRIVAEQVEHLDTEMSTLDTIVSKIQTQNNTAHATRLASFNSLASTVQETYSSIFSTLSTTLDHTNTFDTDMSSTTTGLQATLHSLIPIAELRQPLTELRDQITGAKLDEYVPTGTSPTPKDYAYPTSLPRTASRDTILARLRSAGPHPHSSPAKSPSKPRVYIDFTASSNSPVRPTTSSSNTSSNTSTGLRELDPNTVNNTLNTLPTIPSPTKDVLAALPTLKRPRAAAERDGPVKRRVGARSTVTGTLDRHGGENMMGENVKVPELSASVGVGSVRPGRKLRSHDRS